MDHLENGAGNHQFNSMSIIKSASLFGIANGGAGGGTGGVGGIGGGGGGGGGGGDKEEVDGGDWSPMENGSTDSSQGEQQDADRGHTMERNVSTSRDPLHLERRVCLFVYLFIS